MSYSVTFYCMRDKFRSTYPLIHTTPLFYSMRIFSLATEYSK